MYPGRDVSVPCLFASQHTGSLISPPFRVSPDLGGVTVRTGSSLGAEGFFAVGVKAEDSVGRANSRRMIRLLLVAGVDPL